MNTKVLIVINPVSGQTDKEIFKKNAIELFQFYGIDYKIYETTGKNDEEAITKMVQTFKPDKVAVAGGDGTVLEVANALQDSGVPIGIVPQGSANGLAFELSIKESPIEALKDILLTQHVRKLDRLVFNDTYSCLHLADVGVNARLVKAYERSEKRGMAAYAKAFLTELGNFDKFEYEIKTPEKNYSGKAVMIAFCNARHFGTGIPINSISTPFDGQFEIVIITDINASMIFDASLSYFDKSFAENHNAQTIQTKKAQISFPEKRLFQSDGEIIGEYRQLNLKIVQHEIPVLLTGANPNIG